MREIAKAGGRVLEQVEHERREGHVVEAAEGRDDLQVADEHLDDGGHVAERAGRHAQTQPRDEAADAEPRLLSRGERRGCRRGFRGFG